MSQLPRDESPEWDKTTASIASLSSDDLSASRPNRWRGPKSTWSTLTQEDRSVYDALEARRRRDLAVHLYDAVALKRRRRRIGEGGELGGYEEEDDEGRWLPPRSWTAWPTNPRDVPPDDFMPVQPLDEDSAFTYRRRGRDFPRNALAEEIEASILRLANERFKAWEEERKMTSEAAPSRGDVDDARISDSTTESENDVGSESATETGSALSETMNSESESEQGPRRRKVPKLRAVAAADDVVSHAILKPAVGDIVAKLEKTLTVLHKMMASTIQAAAADNSDEDEYAENDTGVDEPARTGPQPEPAESWRSLSRARQQGKRPRPTSKASRPSVELEDAEFNTTRHGSPQKKPRRTTANPNQGGPIEEEPTTASGPSLSRGPSPELYDRPAGKNHRARAVRLNRPRPRDWRTVLGAASMAGFSHATVVRATQRCADLFGEGVDLRVLTDHLPARDAATAVRPGGEVPPEAWDNDGGDDDDDYYEAAEVARMRLATRDSARRAERAEEPQAGGPRTRSQTPRTTPQRSPRSSRSRSRSATPHLTCPHRACPRSVDAFSRRANLLRHVETVHGGSGGSGGSGGGGEGAAAGGFEVDSEDEVEGGVHVDGFLRQVRVRKGWRGGDVEERRGRGRSMVEVEDEEDLEDLEDVGYYGGTLDELR